MVGEAIDWVLRLGNEHGVDPLVYGLIWVGSLPLFLLSLGWLVRSRRRGAPPMLPLILSAFFFLAPTLYVFAAGRDLPAWVYVFFIALAIVGAMATIRSVRARLRRRTPIS